MSDYTIVVIWVTKIFLYSSSVYSCHLFLISSASVRSIPFLSFMVPIFPWNVTLVSLNFPKEISSLTHSIIFSSISLHCSHRKSFLSLLVLFAIQMGIFFPFLLCLSFLFFSAICKTSLDNSLSFCISFSFGWFWSWPSLVTEVKESSHNAGGLGLFPGSGRSPGKGNGNPLQYSCLENPMDRGAWWATDHWVVKSWTWLSNFTLLHFLYSVTNFHPKFFRHSIRSNHLNLFVTSTANWCINASCMHKSRNLI